MVIIMTALGRPRAKRATTTDDDEIEPLGLPSIQCGDRSASKYGRPLEVSFPHLQAQHYRDRDRMGCSGADKETYVCMVSMGNQTRPQAATSRNSI